ncbi:MAG: hypothetical protein ABI643_01740 [Candidatus Doudnabacteria bacterium]
METNIKKILEIAVLAPSGDNSQPWKFSIKDDTLYVILVRNADDSAYNFMERGSLIGHGAVLENINIISRHLGLNANIQLFPEGKNSDLVAKISFLPTANQDTGLFEAIEKRCTNRKQYKALNISANHEKEILSIPLEKPLLNFSLLKDRAKITDLANTINLNERMFLENYYVHKGLFGFIRWTKEEELKYKTGMYIKTLELQPPQEFAMKIFRRWPIINFFNKFNIAAMVAKDSAKLYTTSAAFGLITAPDLSEESLIATGRMMQRIWLTATKLGVSMQPTAGLLYLAQRVNEEGTKIFSAKHVEMLKTAEQKIKGIFKLSNEVPTLLFRLGYADPPSATSIKHPYLLKNI